MGGVPHTTSGGSGKGPPSGGVPHPAGGPQSSHGPEPSNPEKTAENIDEESAARIKERAELRRLHREMAQRLNDRDVCSKSRKRQEKEIFEMLEKAKQDAARAALLYPTTAPRTPPVISGEIEDDEEAWHLPPSLGVYEKYLRRMTQ